MINRIIKFDVPERPLRAARTPPRLHDRGCVQVWAEVRPNQWTDAQRARAHNQITPEYMDGCPGCEDLIGYRQMLNRRQETS